MFKKIIIFLFLAVLSLSLTAPALTADYGLNDFSKGAGYSTDTRDVYAIINIIIQVFLSLIAIILFVLIFYAGIRWMTAQGREEEVRKAKDIIEGAGVGLAIVLAAYGITYFVFSKLIGGP